MVGAGGGPREELLPLSSGRELHREEREVGCRQEQDLCRILELHLRQRMSRLLGEAAPRREGDK